jgi:hypothetical protein
MALRSGRDILAADDAGAPPVVVVNERTAREFWPGKDAVGQQLQVFGPAPAVVIGVVNDVRPRLAVEPDIEVYVPLSQAPDQVLRFVVRTTTDPLAVVRRLEPRIEQITGNRVSSLTAVDTYIARSVHGPRFRALLFGLMGLLVVVLTAVGVFSVTAHVVAQRHREMGIRMAIGAQARQVARMMVAQTAVPVMVGLGLGLFGALATTTLVARFLYATTPTDPATFVVVLCLVVATSLTAAWLPARRALRIDPLKVLRLE